MTIVVNGEPRQVADQTTVGELIEQLGMTARHVAVEVNLSLVPRAQHHAVRLNDGDRLEVVTLVGGG